MIDQPTLDRLVRRCIREAFTAVAEALAAAIPDAGSGLAPPRAGAGPVAAGRPGSRRSEGGRPPRAAGRTAAAIS